MIAEYSVTLENKTKSELILFINELQDMLKENSAEIEKKNTELAEKNAEIETLNRQIDLMSEELIGVPIDNNNLDWEHPYRRDDFIFLDSKEEVKQYFEKLAERKSKNEN